MCFKDAERLPAHDRRRADGADVLGEDGRAVVWKSKMAAELHIIKRCRSNQNLRPTSLPYVFKPTTGEETKM